MNTLVIIPAYNEAESIQDVVAALSPYEYDFIIINDGSSDTTSHLCELNAIPVINLPNNLGIGGAVQAGHQFALEQGYDIDVQFDGDGQHEASCIKDLVSQIENGADLAIGSRFLLDGEGFQSTVLRRLGIKWLSGLIRIFTGKTITDPTSGFRACGSRAIELFAAEYPTDYPEPESVVEGIRQGFSVVETSTTMHPRAAGSSSITPLKSIYYMIKVSLAIVIASIPDPSQRKELQ